MQGSFRSARLAKLKSIRFWLSETSHGTMQLCTRAHMACMRPWPCTHAVVRLPQRSTFEPKPFSPALGSDCAPTEISTNKPWNLVGLGIYGETNNVTDTTVALHPITSVITSQGCMQYAWRVRLLQFSCFIRVAVNVVACTIDLTLDKTRQDRWPHLSRRCATRIKGV